MNQKKEAARYVWHELENKKDEFQRIVRLLVDFDETTGRYRRYGDPETHYMRKSVSVADEDALRIFICHLGGFVYYIVAEISNSGGTVSTGWVHEDGIRTERDEFREQKDHPVHGIVCMTDLMDQYTKKLEEDFSECALGAHTLELLSDGIRRIREKENP